MEENEMGVFDLRGIPEDWKRAMKKVFSCYPTECMPMGICDMAYMINTLAHELGLGDGRGNFVKLKGGKQ